MFEGVAWVEGEQGGARKRQKLIYPTISHGNGMQKAQPMFVGN